MSEAEVRTTLGKIAIVGTGAVGGYYGGRLVMYGEDVHFLLRSDYEVAKESGFTLRRGEDTFQFPVQTYHQSEDMGVCDWVIITLKSTANEHLERLLAPLVGPDTRLLTLQNGFCNVELLKKLFPENRIFGGLCFVCINRVAPAVFENYLPGYVEMGVGSNATVEELQPMADVWNAAVSKCRIVEPLQEALWRKLCWNIPFNGLAISAGGITTDLILADETLVARSWALMREIQKACPHRIPDEFLQLQFDNTAKMGPYRPSSLIDYLAGKAVEIEAIWGNPLREGLARGVPMPELSKLYEELRERLGLDK